ncbi:MAG TPA: group 1 truncated hemoglobin [Bacteroidota bacterium]|jgi:hemoglobin
MVRQHRVNTFRLVLVLLGLSTLWSIPGAISQEKKAESLYKRLGGYDAIAAVIDDFVPRLAKDPQLGKFFAGHSMDSKKRLRQHVVDQICEATGGPCVYTGRPLKVAHSGLGITESDWQVAVGHLVTTLDKFSVPKQEQSELLAILTSVKPDIVAPAAVPAEKK